MAHARAIHIGKRSQAVDVMGLCERAHGLQLCMVKSKITARKICSENSRVLFVNRGTLLTVLGGINILRKIVAMPRKRNF